MSSPSVEELTRSLEMEQLVTLVVGSSSTEQHEFKVQRAILVNASPYFKSALTKGWKEMGEVRLPLHEVDLEVVKHFLYFLIKRELRLPDRTKDNEALGIRLWVFANKYLMPKLQNEAMKYLHHALQPRVGGLFPSAATVAEAFETSSETSPLYKSMMSALLVGLYNGNICQERIGSGYQLGQYTAKDMEVLEAVPGLMNKLLYNIMVTGKSRIKMPNLAELLVKET